MKNKLLPILSVLILIAAVGLFLYPTVSEWINCMTSKSEIVHYNDTVDTLSADEKEELLRQAEEYNRSLNQAVSDVFTSEVFSEGDKYLDLLNVTENGQIGTITISSIDCSLPIYHSGDDMLSKGAVHLAGTSLPVGGSSTHAVISAHTAYPGRVFFDRLTELQIGDEFSVTVLGDTLYYTVVDVNVVLPSDTEHLSVEQGEDLVTLVTCTPYSVNTHRLLVTGERTYKPILSVSTSDEAEFEITGESRSVSLPVLFIVFGVGIFVIIIAVTVRRKRKK